jgi:hypothetical protein
MFLPGWDGSLDRSPAAAQCAGAKDSGMSPFGGGISSFAKGWNNLFTRIMPATLAVPLLVDQPYAGAKAQLRGGHQDHVE